jgi:predicted lipid-binding transport protein (Tim44 family)
MKKSKKNRFNILVVFVALCFLFFLGMESLAFARAGGGRSSGSSGFSSGGTSGGAYRSAPSQPSSGFQQRPQAPTPAAPPPAAPSFGRSMLYGIGGGLIGGAIGSMLFGGHGFAGGGGGWGGGGFGFSDFIIILIILGIVYFIFKRYRAKKQEEMQMSAAGAGYGQSYGYNEPAPQQYEPAAASQEDRVSQGLRYIKEMDAAFDKARFKEYVEDNFFRIQSAWTKRDITGVRSLLSTQMADTFQNDINNYAANRQFNRLENIAVREVEVVDAGQDQGEEYITVKFLASLLDYTVDETTNKTISGSPTDPVKFLEYWTFQRRIGERNWLLGGITQEGDYR